MPVRFSAAILSASLVLFAVASAQAQTWPPRLISRTVDVTRISTIDAVEYFSGEQVTYQIRGHAGSPTNYAALPTNAVGIWYATDDTFTNYFIVWTNSAQSNATGFMEFVLPTPYSALTAKTYESWVNVYGGTPTNGSTPIGVFDRLQLKVKRNASYAGTYRGPITYTNVTLDGNTYVAPGFWALHAPDINAVITGLAASASAGTTAAFFQVYATNMSFDPGTNLLSQWVTVPLPGTGAVFGFSVTNGTAYCQTPGIYSVDAFGELLTGGNPGEYSWAVFVNDAIVADAAFLGNPAPSYKDIKLGSLVTLTNGALVSTKLKVVDNDPNPTHALTFARTVLRAVNTVSALASNVTVTIGGGSGTSTNVIFENLDGNGDVGPGSNQVARGSDLAAKADSNIVYTAIATKATSNTVYTAIAAKADSSTVYSALSGKAATSHAHTGSDISDGTISNADLSASAFTLFTNDQYSILVAGTGRISVTATTNNNVTTYTVNGSGAALFSAFGVTNSNWCGTYWSIAYSGANSHSVTGCFSYVTAVDTNGPASGGGAAYTNTFTGGASSGAVVGAGTDTNKYLSQNGTWEDDKSVAGGGDVYLGSNNTMIAGKTNFTVLGVHQFATNATDTDRFGIHAARWADANVLLIRNMDGPRSDVTVVPGQDGTGTVAAIKVTDAMGGTNVTLVMRYNRSFGGTHTNGFAFTIKNSGGAALQPLFFLIDEAEAFHYGPDTRVKFQNELYAPTMGLGTTNLAGEQFRIQAANPFVSINATSAGDYSVLNFRENGTQMSVLQQMGSSLGGSLGAGTRANDLEIANVVGGDIVFGTGSGSWGTKFVVISSTDSRMGISYRAPPEALCVSGNVVIVGSRQINGIWQGNFLGPYAGVNPSTVIPVRQGDYFMDTTSNTLVVSTTGNTNGWRYINLQPF